MTLVLHPRGTVQLLRSIASVAGHRSDAGVDRLPVGPWRTGAHSAPRPRQSGRSAPACCRQVRRFGRFSTSAGWLALSRAAASTRAGLPIRAGWPASRLAAVPPCQCQPLGQLLVPIPPHSLLRPFDRLTFRTFRSAAVPRLASFVSGLAAPSARTGMGGPQLWFSLHTIAGRAVDSGNSDGEVFALNALDSDAVSVGRYGHAVHNSWVQRTKDDVSITIQAVSEGEATVMSRGCTGKGVRVHVVHLGGFQSWNRGKLAPTGREKRTLFVWAGCDGVVHRP